MIPLAHLKGEEIAIVGLGRSGMSSVAACLASKADVFVFDDNKAICHQADKMGAHYSRLDDFVWGSVKALVLAPGIPLYFPAPHPWAAAARAARVPIICDIELFAQARAALPPHKVIGITGTNGKSTTTALIAHIIREAGLPVVMGGNIGIPILDHDPLPTGGVYVLELSSYQIDLLHSLQCDVAVLTNMTPDHLDRHGDFAGYVAAKERLFAQRGDSGVAVIGTDDAASQGIFERAATPKVAISKNDILGDQSAWPALQGVHNAQNVAAAVAACAAIGLSRADILASLKTFPGLAHRMERIGTKHGVLYVNDSKATNADSTAPALSAYANILWIAGGRRKSDELDACLPYLKNVRAAYVIGEATDIFDQILSPHLQVIKCRTLDNAVSAAAKAARAGEVVLLSPACASQDQFKDFEARGDAFRAAVEKLT
jgi:UDP-N-acetylmuramoylalanine--D-glutamate ligase